MIKRVGVSQKDTVTLARLMKHRTVVDKAQPVDYKNKVVIKPWGYEYLIFENEYTAIWFLHIKKEHSTSMHCHPKKKTCLILLSGGALCNTFLNRNYLNGVEAVVIDRSVFHSTQALSPDGIDVIEIETPPNKTDLVRLNDEYGREMLGYEGFTEMQTENLERFRHFYFDEPDTHGKFAHQSGEHVVSMEAYPDNGWFQDVFSVNDNELYSPCRGRLLSNSGEVVLDVGDVQIGSVLREHHKRGMKIDEKTLLISARSK